MLSLEKHPDKTFIGRIERGFDFPAYHFSPAGVTVAKQTIANFIEKASRLYEQERRAGSAVSPLEMYVRQWLRWARAGASDRKGRTRCIAAGNPESSALAESPACRMKIRPQQCKCGRTII